MPFRPLASWSATILALALAACGGGGDSSTPVVASTAQPVPVDPNAPAITGDTATDAINRFNFRRQQAGLLPLSRNVAIDRAAQAHSDYQRLNDLISHAEETSRPGFTGADPFTRMQAAGYSFPASSGYAYGEVIASRSDTQGAGAAEDLLAAIYHRFIVLEPIFKEAGSGSGTVQGGLTYVTVDFATTGFDRALPRGSVVTYPVAGQADVPTGFNSDQESPDPVPNQNRVGYPVSVHANLGATLTVQTFTIVPRGGTAMTTRLLTHTNDANAPSSGAAIIPLAQLAAGTTYDVQFAGSVDGTPVTRNWSFSTP